MSTLKKIIVFGLGAGIGYLVARILATRAQKPPAPPPPPGVPQPPIGYPPPQPPPRQPVLPEHISIKQPVETRPAPARQLTSKKVTLAPGEEYQYVTLPDTDFVVITIYGTPVQISFGSPVTEDTQLYPTGATVVHPVPPVDIYFKNPSTTDTATVYISEWRYEK